MSQNQKVTSIFKMPNVTNALQQKSATAISGSYIHNADRKASTTVASPRRCIFAYNHRLKSVVLFNNNNK